MNLQSSTPAAQSIRLTCREGTSNKEYRAQLVASGGGWVLRAQHGPIGGTMNVADKITTPVVYERALREYLKLVKSKLAKGYVTSDQVVTGLVDVPLKAFDATDIRPMLLHPIDDDELDQYLLDPQYSAEEKHDGERRILVVEASEAGTAVYGVNRKGVRVPLPETVDTAIRAQIGGNVKGRTVLDGEIIGETVYLWDVMEHEGRNLRPEPLVKRRAVLARLIATCDNVKLTRVALTTQDKRALLERVRAARREGIVFKRNGAAYVAGLKSSDADWHKYKFVQSVTVRVRAPNVGKRSVRVEAHDDEGHWQALGNVTIPPNHSVPESGAIVEVEYLFVAKVGGALYQPVYLRERADQDEGDCLLSQLKYKGLAEAA